MRIPDAADDDELPEEDSDDRDVEGEDYNARESAPLLPTSSVSQLGTNSFWKINVSDIRRD